MVRKTDGGPTNQVAKLGGQHGPFADFQSLLSTLAFESVAQHPEAPTSGDVIKYRDGTVAMVGDSPHVSYGPREEMVEVARLFPRPKPATPADEAGSAT